MQAPPRGVPRPAKVVIGEALDELRERADHLQRFESEATDTRRLIKMLERAIGDTQPTAGQNGVGETKRAILDCVSRSLEPLTMVQVAEKIERKPAGWLTMQLNRLVGSGQLALHDGERYGTPPALETGEAA